MAAPDRYDDDEILTRYVLAHFGYLLPARQVVLLKYAYQRLKRWDDESLQKPPVRRWLGLDDPDASKVFENGPLAFMRTLRDQLLSERKDKIRINRCPKCSRIVRTPKAQQCLWCGFDWHG
jgi:hypothetical protein